MKAAEWVGAVGDTWAKAWAGTDRSFAGLEPALERAILAAAPVGATRLVDIGCGAGTTSLALADALPRAEVVGLDLSPALVAIAAARASERGLAPDRCRFITGDAATLVGSVQPIDLFFSRHGVMFFNDPVASFTALAAAGAPGARLVFSCFAALADNPWATEPIAAPIAAPSGEPEPGPFAFSDPGRVAAILAAAGWVPSSPPERVTFRYVAGAGSDAVAEAVAFFRRIGPAARALKQADEAERPRLLDRIAAACARRLDRGEVAFPAAAWLWSARLRESMS